METRQSLPAAVSFEVVEWSEQLRSVISAWPDAVRRSVQVRLCTSGCKIEKMFGIIIVIIIIITIIIIIIIIIVVVHTSHYIHIHIYTITNTCGNALYRRIYSSSTTHSKLMR